MGITLLLGALAITCLIYGFTYSVISGLQIMRLVEPWAGEFLGVFACVLTVITASMVVSGVLMAAFTGTMHYIDPSFPGPAQLGHQS